MVDFKELRKTVDSNEEVYFIWWLEELLKEEIILKYERAYSFSLVETVRSNYEKVLKTKTKVIDFNLLQEHIYTPDFKVIINKDSPRLGEFFVDINNLHEGVVKRDKSYLLYNDDKCIVEVKGDFDSNNMTRLFKLNQKWVYDKHGIYVNLVKLPVFFKKTFYPERYLLTDITMKKRTITGEVKTLN